MRVAVVYFSGRNSDKLASLAKSLARGIERQGNQVDVFDGESDSNAKLTIFQYIAVGTVPASLFGGRLPESVKAFLASRGVVSGKRSYAFVGKSAFGAQKALTNLMKCMEGEGMYLKSSDVLRSPTEAEEIGKRLHIA